MDTRKTDISKLSDEEVKEIAKRIVKAFTGAANAIRNMVNGLRSIAKQNPEYFKKAEAKRKARIKHQKRVANRQKLYEKKKRLGRV